MQSFSRIAFAFLIVPGLLLGCKATSESTDVAEVPNDFGVVFGEGGGFTGMWSGYTIAPDGTVSSWRGKAAEENPRQVGRLSAGQRAALWTFLNESKFRDLRSTEVGDLTRFIKIVVDGETFEATWIPPGNDDTGVAAQLQAVLDHCRTLVPPEDPEAEPEKEPEAD